LYFYIHISSSYFSSPTLPFPPSMEV